MKPEYRSLRVGIVGIGLDTYWPQFAGLRERLLSYLQTLERTAAAPNREIVSLGLIDTPEAALRAGHRCRTEDLDLLCIYATTYALSSTVLPIVARAGIPTLLLNLQPTAAIDYQQFNRLADRTAMTGEWLAWCGSCPVPEIANVFTRLGIPVHQVTGMLHDDPHVREELDAWMRAAWAAKMLAHSRLGLMGHYYGGMLDVATDLTQVCGTFGLHLQQLEVDELTALRRDAAPAEIAAKLDAFRQFFDISPECSAAELERAAHTAVALDRLVRRNDLDLLAYYAMGTGVAENENTMSSVILGCSMLTAAHVPVAGEYEVKNVIAMKILDLLGAGGSFTEFYAMDYTRDVVLMGHDGPGHVGIAQDKIRVRPLQVYHGKVGQGLSVEMAVRYGPVTLLSVAENRSTSPTAPRSAPFKLLVAEGESISGEILEIGNTNSQYRFPLGARQFVEQWNANGPAHHCAVGVGHHSRALRKLAALLGIEYTQIC